MKTVTQEARERMRKSLEAFEHNIHVVRTGRANPAMLQRVMVDYYGASTPLNQLANVSSPDPRTLTISPYDKSAVRSIEKAILESDLGFNPNNQGDAIFITVPPLNDERRRDLVRTVKGMAEEAKVAIRNIRRDANDEIRELLREHLVGEDEARSGENEVQRITDEFVALIDQRTRAKEEDILAV
jgi:ribosome recycling factor